MLSLSCSASALIAPGDDLQVALKVAQLGVLFFVDKVPQTMGM